MSLFPAYSGENVSEDAKKEVATSWTSNSSFNICVTGIKPKSIDDDSESSEDSNCQTLSKLQTPETAKRKSSSSSGTDESSRNEKERRKRHKREKRGKKKKKKYEKDVEIISNEDLPFVVDVARDLGYLNMEQQSKRARPRYEMAKKRLSGVYAAKMKLRARKKAVRYFSKKIVRSGQNNEAVGEELKNKVALLNQAVHENTHDVESWLNLVHFQDDFFKFQAIQFKTAGDRNRAVNNQKLAILERALTVNPNEDNLQKLWLALAVESYSSDEVEAKLMTIGSSGSMFLCLGRIMLIQQSVVLCKIPSVMKAYREAMDKLQKSRCGTPEQQDQNTLELLYYACMFLEQGGLWEGAWKTLELTLDINLSLAIPDVSAFEQIVLEEENKILQRSKGVPVWHLWTSLETLRQGYHFLPVKSSENFPQRVVATDEVAELVHYVRRPAHFRLLFLLPLLANVPLLPRSHCLLEAILPQLSSWALDTVEWQLAAVFSQSPIFKISGKLLADHLPQSHPPQYLRALPGQLEFLELVIQVFHLVLEATSGRQRVAIGVWYLRLWRWLDQLAKMSRFEPPPGRPKTKAVFKEFLKKEVNRNTLLFYVEYGLWEFEQGDTTAGIKTLNTLVTSRGAVLDQSDESTKADLCALYRTLAELQIVAGHCDDAKTTLKQLCQTSSDAIACSKLRHVALENKCDDVESDLEDLLLPNFAVDWLSCYALFLAVMGAVQDALDYLNQIISTTSEPFIRERLFETLIAIHRSFVKDKAFSEVPTVREMLSEFPLSSVATTVMAEALTNGGGLWWKDMACLVRDTAAMGAVVGVCATLERQRRHGTQHNRVRGLLKQQTTGGGRTSALIHRIHMAFLARNSDLEGLETARVLALEACPWNKSVYMDAITLCPAQMQSLTDILIEKDLRIHITPDEVEVLRD